MGPCGLRVLFGFAVFLVAKADREPESAVSCWGDEDDWNTQSPAFLEEAPGSNAGDPWSQIGNTFGSGVEWLFKLMPGMRGKLYGRSLTPPCRCEACAYTLDTLIMYLDEDTMGWYTPEDIQHIMMDRFCYGIKWLYRSACHHILTAYFDDIAAMAMGHMTGLDICRVLRFCPYYYSGGNLAWSNMRAFPFMGGGNSASPSQSSGTSQSLLTPGLEVNPRDSVSQPQLQQTMPQQLMQPPAQQQLLQPGSLQQQPQQPQQQFQSQDIPPVGFKTNPAAQQAASYQQLLGSGGGMM